MHHHDLTAVSSGCAWHAAFIVQEQRILILMLQGWQQNFNLGIVLVTKKWHAWSAGGMHVLQQCEHVASKGHELQLPVL